MGVVDLVVLDRLLRATSKKRSLNFLRKKVHPPDKILATPMIKRLCPPGLSVFTVPNATSHPVAD